MPKVVERNGTQLIGLFIRHSAQKTKNSEFAYPLRVVTTKKAM